MQLSCITHRLAFFIIVPISLRTLRLCGGLFVVRIRGAVIQVH